MNERVLVFWFDCLDSIFKLEKTGFAFESLGMKNLHNRENEADALSVPKTCYSKLVRPLIRQRLLFRKRRNGQNVY